MLMVSPDHAQSTGDRKHRPHSGTVCERRCRSRDSVRKGLFTQYTHEETCLSLFAFARVRVKLCRPFFLPCHAMRSLTQYLCQASLSSAMASSLSLSLSLCLSLSLSFLPVFHLPLPLPLPLLIRT